MHNFPSVVLLDPIQAYKIDANDAVRQTEDLSNTSPNYLTSDSTAF
jgi:hypothetical protein